jgi:hypothetical protein
MDKRIRVIEAGVRLVIVCLSVTTMSGALNRPSNRDPIDSLEILSHPNQLYFQLFSPSLKIVHICNVLAILL